MLRNATNRDVIYNRQPRQYDLNAGDIAVNAADGIAYTKLLNNQVVPIRAWAIGGSASGGGPSTPTTLPIATHHSLGVVQVGAHLSISSAGLLDVNIPGGALEYKGVANPPDAAPNSPETGDTWILTAGIFGSTWIGVAGTEADPGDLVLWDGRQWDLIAGANPVAGVHAVRVTAPILLGGTAKDPVIGVRQATDAQTGVVRLATQAELTTGSHDAVITATQFKPVRDAAFAPGVAYNLPPATTQSLGGVIVGSGLRVAADGTLSSILGVLSYKGTVTPTDHPPKNPATGDTYITRAGVFTPEWTGAGGQEAAAGDLILWDGTQWDLIAGANHIAGVHQVYAAEPIYLAGTAKDPEVHVRDATTATAGVVRLADAAAITAGTAGRVVDAAQLKAAVPALPIATQTRLGVISVGDHLAITPAGRLSAVFPGALTFRGMLNAASNAPMGASAGDTWLFRDSGTLNSSWGAVAGEPVNDHDMVMMADDGKWHIVGDLFTGILAGVTGDAPIVIDRSDPQHPHIKILDASTSQKGAVQLSSAVNSTSDTLAATASAVKKANDAANSANSNANNRVLRAGDTMTGDLILNSQAAAVQLRPKRDSGGFEIRDAGDPSGTYSRLYQTTDGRTAQYGSRGVTLATGNGQSVRLAPDWVESYLFTTGYAKFLKPLTVGGQANGTPALTVRADNQSDQHSILEFKSNNESTYYARIDARWTRTDYAGRKEVWIRAAQEDQWGFVQFHGGSSAGTPFVFSRGSESSGRIADVDGSGNWHTVSDKRKKHKFGPMSPLGLDAVLQMNPCRFRMVDEGEDAPERLGFIAQEMEPIVPHAVKQNEDGIYSLAPSVLIPVLVQAIQELTARVAALEGP